MMSNYYFTFGQSHFTTDGQPMKNFWVKVIAEDYGGAREKFIERFTKEYMSAPDKWAFQYEEHDFNEDYFPEGEFTVIN